MKYAEALHMPLPDMVSLGDTGEKSSNCGIKNDENKSDIIHFNTVS